MPFLLIPLSWALGKMGLALTFTGGASAMLGKGAIAAWAVTTAKGTILVSAAAAYKAFAIGGLTALGALLAPFTG